MRYDTLKGRLCVLFTEKNYMALKFLNPGTGDLQ